MIPALWTAVLAAEMMTLVVGRGAVVDCPAGVARVSTSNPEAVDTVLASDSELLLQAKAAGQSPSSRSSWRKPISAICKGSSPSSNRPDLEIR